MTFKEHGGDSEWKKKKKNSRMSNKKRGEK